jgi:hypothetical protein
MKIMRHSRKSRSHGTSMIELALLLPVLLMLVFGVIDFGRALLFNNILVGMSREGANSAARSSATPAAIITALGTTGLPLQMNPNGMIYITTLIGIDGTASAKVQSQYRYTSGNSALVSKIYACGGWGAGGVCNLSTPLPTVSNLPLTLAAGELVRVAESTYYFAPLAGYVMRTPITLYSATIL